MTDFYDHLASFGDAESCMAELQKNCGFESVDQTRALYLAAASNLGAGLAELTKTRVGTRSVVEFSSGLTWAERDRPESLFAIRMHSIGSLLLSALYPNSTATSIDGFAAQAGVPSAGAAVLFETTAAVCLATLCATLGPSLDDEVLLGYFHKGQLVNPVTGSAPSGSHFPPPTAATASARALPQARYTRPRWALPALLVVALLGVAGFAVLSIGNDDATDTVTAETLDVPPVTAQASVVPAAPEADAIAPSGSENQLVSLAVEMRQMGDPTGPVKGQVQLDFDNEYGQVCYQISLNDQKGPYRAHIHVGSSTVMGGGIVVDLGEVGGGDESCVPSSSRENLPVLADRAGHYLMLHDPEKSWTMRGQLSELVTDTDSLADVSEADKVTDGAVIVVSEGTISLEGEVPDQDAADELQASLSGVDSTIVNNLRVVPGAPVPEGRVRVADQVFFETDSAQTIIEPSSLATIVGLANGRPDWLLTIVGHTDSVGAETTNLELSLARAQVIRDLLVEQGVPADSMRIRGAGELAPIGDNEDAAGRAMNRRIEFEFTTE